MKWIENRYVKITLFVLSLFAIIIIVILSNFNTNKEKKTIKNNEVSENYIENVYEIGEFGKDYHDGISDFYDIAGANSDDDADTLIKNNMLSNSNDIENLIIKDNDAYELKHIDCGDGVYRRKIEDYDIFVLSKKSINENLNLSYISSIRSSFDAFISAKMESNPAFLAFSNSFLAICKQFPLIKSPAYFIAPSIKGAPDALEIISISLLKFSPIPGP